MILCIFFNVAYLADLVQTWTRHDTFSFFFYFFVHFSSYLSVFVVVFSSKLINFGENHKGVHCKNFQILIILVIFSFFFSFYLSVFIQSFWSNLIKIFKIWSLFILTKILDGSILQLWRFVDSCLGVSAISNGTFSDFSFLGVLKKFQVTCMILNLEKFLWLWKFFTYFDFFIFEKN